MKLDDTMAMLNRNEVRKKQIAAIPLKCEPIKTGSMTNDFSKKLCHQLALRPGEGSSIHQIEKSKTMDVPDYANYQVKYNPLLLVHLKR